MEPLPSFRDVPAADRQLLFSKKLQLSTFTFDFMDATRHVREKELKRQTLLELVDYVNTGQVPPSFVPPQIPFGPSPTPLTENPDVRCAVRRAYGWIVAWSFRAKAPCSTAQRFWAAVPWSRRDREAIYPPPAGGHSLSSSCSQRPACRPADSRETGG